MPTPFRTELDRDRFLQNPRLAVLISQRPDHSALGVPVWFDWAEGQVRMFAARSSPKVARLRARPEASVLVTNQVGEPEAWVAFDGGIKVHDHGGLELATRLAARYWSLDDPDRVATLTTWQQAPDEFVLLTLDPDRIRTGQ